MHKPVRGGSRELIGWSEGTRLRGTRQPGASVSRRVVATALGVAPKALEPLDAETLRTALRHLRELEVRADTLAEQAATDDLTGALRRGTGLAMLQRELDRARRTRGPGTMVAFIDVDGLKRVNDAEGHPAGDQLLRDVVAAIRERVRSYDLVIRYGGDEFVCVLTDATPAQADKTIDDIRHFIEMRTAGHTISVGLVAARETDDAARVVGRADAALYRVRRSSKVPRGDKA
ncbi:MAG: GGDEF domain-containing protein [Chloroflexi bacterium]|nr:MAG: GGDEF domain-containing protein [Chloroflexota bacterium]TMB90703.1 MAG: GGDEF domain-containing protein [Chloroflexota bacterium]